MEAYSIHHQCTDCGKKYQIYMTDFLYNYTYSYSCQICGHQNQFAFNDLGDAPVHETAPTIEASIPGDAVIAERIIP